MRVHKKGKYYHFEFEFEGGRFQGSTRRKNEREAIQIAGAKQFNVEDQIRRTRSALKLPSDAGLHALRHTFLTLAGKLTQNVKALQLLAGHSNIATTMKYIHPEESDIFGIVAAMSSATSEKPRDTERTVRKTTASASGD